MTKAARAERQQSPRIQYRIQLADPAAHLFGIELRIEQPAPDGQVLTLPAWIPGSYMIRDFARHIVQIDAICRDEKVVLDKTDKQTWRAEPCDGPLIVRYQVYAWDLSVRGAHADQTHAFFNGTSVFLAVCGQENDPVGLEILPPATPELHDWRVATTMPTDGAEVWGFGQYTAGNYDELIDHPVEMGRFETVSFQAGGARHEVVVTGGDQVDLKRLATDLKPVCQAQAALFDPEHARTPVKRYLFLTMAVDDGYGGLEHRASTALICRRSDLPYKGMKEATEGYRTFLGLASHEYFHTWNVKRIKPAAFSPYRLAAESYTRLLWVFEGFTSYYDDLMLVRTGKLTATQYLDLLGKTISRVQQGPGASLQSAAASSFDAWTRFYRQDENAPNAIVSYYAKGALIALALDLTIRHKSGNKHSLDDVMRLLWNQFGRDFERTGRGVGENEMPALIEAATGVRTGRQIADWAEGTRPIPLANLLRRAGIALRMTAGDAATPWMGWRLREQGGQCRIAQVLTNSPAHQAGLSAGDVLVALDGYRIGSEKAIDALLLRRGPDTAASLHVFRADRLTSFTIKPVAPPAHTAELKLTQPRLASFMRGPA